MVLAWYMDDSPDDQKTRHQLVPEEFVSLDQLKELGVLHWTVAGEPIEESPLLSKIRAERGYNYFDVVEVTPTKLPNYDVKVKQFFEEHLHTDEEIRLILEGSGYFDVRSKDDRWIRIAVNKGDLLILPAGIYHRFTVDEQNYIKAMRLFQGVPVWTPINRPDGDVHPCRAQYLTHVVV